MTTDERVAELADALLKLTHAPDAALPNAKLAAATRVARLIITGGADRGDR
jgi:hypothetical protein